MRWHIIRSLSRMRKQRVTIRYLSLHECFQIPHDRGICILADHQRSTGMLNEYMTQTNRYSG